MDRLLPVLAGFAAVFLFIFLVMKYAERAMAERRPGWVADDEDGVRCPQATGPKGPRGEAGREDS